MRLYNSTVKEEQYRNEINAIIVFPKVALKFVTVSQFAEVDQLQPTS